MHLICANTAALAVAVIFYTWRTHQHVQMRREQRLRERIVYMLWIMANRVENPQETLAID